MTPSEDIITKKIMDITIEIQEKYPELIKYLNEMPISNPDEKDPKINEKNLTDYYESLIVITKERNYTNIN